MLSPRVISTLENQNPWQKLGSDLERLAPQTERAPARWLWRRHIQGTQNRFQVILGPRRTGKTVTMYQTVRHCLARKVDPGLLWWVSLDHPLLMRHDLDELVRFVVRRSGASATRPAYLFLDELVYADQWDLWLKQFYDRRLPIRLMASSSAASVLRQGRLESGVGRWEETYLGPCNLAETLDLLGRRVSIYAAPLLSETIAGNLHTPVPAHVSEVRELLLTVGGYPELLLSRADSPGSPMLPGMPPGWGSAELMERLRSDGMERVVYRDLQQSSPISRPLQREKLVYLLADRTGGIISPQNLARDLPITQNTLETYLSHLEWAFMIFTLSNYSGREGTIQRRGRKCYLVDPALRSAILRRPPFRDESPSEQGRLIETLAASHLYALGRQESVRVFHWRRKNRWEIDLIYDDPRQPLAFEVSLSRDHGREGLRVFLEQNPRFKNHCYLVVAHSPISLSPRESPDGIGEIPLDLFLLAVGRQHERALANRLGVPWS